MVHAQFRGDRTEWDAKVDAALHRAFGENPGLLAVDLHYGAGKGYDIVRADFSPPVEEVMSADASTRPPVPPENYTAQVRVVLEGIGAPLA
ncbi:MAG TPA: hypothetical protein VL691_08735 [Vicinamibacteria bacterium]|nr:hypothetical protein [Vicinamibacteria bacterium]